MSINFENVKSVADLRKAGITEDQIIAAVKAYLHNKEYHKIRNAKVNALYKKAVAAGL